MGQEYDCDVLIIGAGILGGAVANALVTQGRSVIILESGLDLKRHELVDNFRSSGNKGDYNSPYPDLAWSPKSSSGQYSDDYIESVGEILQKPSFLRLVGGTTWHWGGATWRMLPNDFKLKSVYGHGRDWPIDYDTLEPWYQLAEEEMGVSGSDTDDQRGWGKGAYPPRSKPYPLKMQPFSYYTQVIAKTVATVGHTFVDEPNGRASEHYQGRPQCAGNNNCAPICPIGALFCGEMPIRWAQKKGAKLISQAVAYKIEKGMSKKIVAIHYMDPDKNTTRLTAKYFVLAANGVEVPKLMLLSDIGNSSGQVGRNLMGHTGRGLEMLVRDQVWSGRGPTQQGSINTWRDTEERHHFAAIRHFTSNIVPNEIITKRLLDKGIVGKTLDKRIREESSRWLKIASYIEVLPEQSNRVMLSQQKDAVGLPKPKTDYNITEPYCLDSLKRINRDYDLFKKAFGATEVLNNPQAWVPSSHIMGTVIMGDKAEDSVVNHECRSFDHDNLFIASTGVHSTSSVVNPTLTGYALALRMADIITKEL